MKCRVCRNTLRKPSPKLNCHERAPMVPKLCYGCWFFTVEMQVFLVRARDRTVMGNWTEGWLKEILDRPAKHRGMEGD